MKRLFLLTFAVLLSLTLIARPRHSVNPKEFDATLTNVMLDDFRSMGYTVLPEVIIQDTLNRKKSNYEKYWEQKEIEAGRGPKHTLQPQKQEWDDVYYQPTKDTVKKHKKLRPQVDRNVVINYHIDYSPFMYSRFYRPYYTHYWFYPSYYDLYFGWDPFWEFSFGYPYYRYDNWFYPWNHYNRWNYVHSWNHNTYNIIKQPTPFYNRYERPSTLTNSNRVYNPNRRPINAPNQRPTYDRRERTYQPTYNKPRMSVRPQFNNSSERIHVNQERMNSMPNSRRTETTVQRRNYSTPSQQRTYNAPAINRRSDIPIQRHESYSSPNQTRTYDSSPRQYNSSPSRSYDGGGSSSGSSRSSSGSSGTRR